MTVKIRENAIVLGFKIYYLAIITDLFYLVFFIIGNNTQIFEADRTAHFIYNIEVLVIFIIIQTIGGILLFLGWYNKCYIFNHDGITIKSGSFWKHEKKYTLKSVDTVNTEKTFLGNILEYGNILIKDSFIEEQVKLTSLSDPDNFAKMIEENYQGEESFTIIRKESRKE